MAKAKVKTIENENNVMEFINSIPDILKQKDSIYLLEVFKSRQDLNQKCGDRA